MAVTSIANLDGLSDSLQTSEAYRILLAKAGRRTGNIPAEALVKHILSIIPADVWPVRLEAMEALLRRSDIARKDELRISEKPSGGQVLGLYNTRRRGSTSRPYRTVLYSIDPMSGSCDCPDFVKNSLGFCKHLISVIDHLLGRPKGEATALKDQERFPTETRPGLRWDPIRPLTGRGDWLERITLVSAAQGKGKAANREAEIRSRWFSANGSSHWKLRKFSNNPDSRLELVNDLRSLLDLVESPFGPDPALQKLLTDESVRLTRVTEQALNPAERRTAWKGLKRPLYPYQREGVSAFLSTGRLLLADDMGLGKTAQAIACADILWRSGRAKKILIIAPAALKPQWAREWMQFSHAEITVVDGSPTERRQIFESAKSGIFIINYEQLLRDLEIIRSWSPDLVVLDEAQRIKNWATKTALSVKGLSPPYRLVLTGTPMENRIEELASIVEWVDDLALEPKWRLGPLHAIRADGKKEVIGVQNLETIRERLRPFMVRRIRQEVLDQLPPRTDVRVPIAMTEPQLAEHDSLIPSIASLVQRAGKRPLTQAEFLKLMSLLTTQRIISNGLAQLRFEEVWPAIKKCTPEDSVLQGLSAPKLIELRQLVRQVVLEQQRKVVIFSQWRRMLTLAHWAIGDLLAEDGSRAGFFTGAEGQRRRTQNLVEFHDDPKHRVLFASDAGGVGLNLQRAANCVINLELPWNPAVLEQRIGRIYRLGQTQPIDVFNLVCEQGIESRISAIVGSKQAFFKGLFDGDSDAIQFEQSGSFLSKVEKLIDPGSLSMANGSTALDVEEVEIADESDEVSDSLDEMLDAADESVQAEPATELVDPSIESTESVVTSPLPIPNEVARLFGDLEVRREPSGKIVIEASEESAQALGALFQGMAQLLKAISPGK